MVSTADVLAENETGTKLVPAIKNIIKNSHNNGNGGKTRHPSDNNEISSPAPENAPPKADAGPTQQVNAGDSLTLNGGGSSDPNGDQLTYFWSQVEGPSVSLNGADTAYPSFTAPAEITDITTLRFELQVSDGKTGTDSDSVDIIVQPTTTNPQKAPSNEQVEQQQQPSQLPQQNLSGTQPTLSPLNATAAPAVSGEAIPLTPNGVARLTIITHVDNTGGGTKQASDFEMQVSGIGVPDNPSVGSFTGSESGHNVVLGPGQFSVTESAISGYSSTPSGQCSGVLTANQTATCTFTNRYVGSSPAPPPAAPIQTAQLTVVTHVDNTGGGTKQASDFEMQVSGIGVPDLRAPSVGKFPGSESGITRVLLPGQFSVSQSPILNYSSTPSGQCSGVLTANQTATCTFTNRYVGSSPGFEADTGKLTVVTNVINANGGTKKPSDFMVYLSGILAQGSNQQQTTTTFPGSESGVTKTLKLGPYSVTQSEVSAYTTTLSEACSGTISKGTSATCIITNRDTQLPSSDGNSNGGAGAGSSTPPTSALPNPEFPLTTVQSNNVTNLQANNNNNNTTAILQINQTVSPQIIQNILSPNICSSKRTPIDIVFSIDSSPSMRDNDPTNLRLNASKSFIDKLNSTTDMAAAVSWGGKIGFESQLASDFSKLKREIGTINIENASIPNSSANTDYNIGINEPIKILDSIPRNSSKIIIFLSDGQNNGAEDPLLPNKPGSLIDIAKSKGYKIYTIGLNIPASTGGDELLKVMAESTGGHFYSSPSAQNLAEIFNSIFVREIQQFEFGKVNVRASVTGGGGSSQISSPIDVVFSIDSSSSMGKTDPDKLRIFSAKFFTDKLNTSRDRAGIVSWTDKIKFSTPLSSDFTNVKEQLDKVGDSGSTDVNLGIREAIRLLDANDRQNASSSKAIIIITDGRSSVPVKVDSLTQEAKQKGYKIYTIGLTIKNGSPEEAELIKIATDTNGQYYFPPTPENLQAAYNSIFQKITESSAALSPKLLEVFPNYVTLDGPFSIAPTNISKNSDGQTVIEWNNIAKYLGNKDDKLSSGEKFDVNFNIGFKGDIAKQTSSSPSGSAAGASSRSSTLTNQIISQQTSTTTTSSNQPGVQQIFKVPIIDDQKSLLSFASPEGKVIEQHVPKTLVDLLLRTCNNNATITNNLTNRVQTIQ